MTRAPRGGFAWIEVLAVVAALAIVGRIALPNVQEARIRARARTAIADVDLVRAAATSYHARTKEWPADAPDGQVPAELVGDLPEGFSFARRGYRLDWERWVLPDGLAGWSGARTLLGVSVATEDARLGNAVAALVGQNGWYGAGNTSTFLMDGM